MKKFFIILLILTPVSSFGQTKVIKKDTTLINGKLPITKKITKKIIIVDQNDEQLSDEYIETPFQGKKEPEIIIEKR